MADSVRVDRWLWAVRAFKTRAQANDACSRGRVRVNGDVCKPATKLKLGDRVEARRKDRVLVYEVAQLLEKRVGAALAAEAVVDHSPPVELPTYGTIAASGQRDRGAGRPTKRERRKIQALRGR